MYVFDTSTLIAIFNYYYKDRFPSFWELFDRMIDSQSISMVEESYNEIGDRDNGLSIWAKANRLCFTKPDVQQALVVREILSITHFQQVIEKRKILQGGYVADPFIIAKAKVQDKSLVTMELHKPNGAKIPNICEHFSVPCLSLEQFMAQEKMRF